MSLTRERINEIAGDRSVNEVCSDEEIKELCRLALTALSAEPVAWELFRDGKWEPCSWFVAHGFEGKLHPECRDLYAAPPDLLAENKRLREALEAIIKDSTMTGAAFTTIVTDNLNVIKARAALREPK